MAAIVQAQGSSVVTTWEGTGREGDTLVVAFGADLQEANRRDALHRAVGFCIDDAPDGARMDMSPFGCVIRFKPKSGYRCWQRGYFLNPVPLRLSGRVPLIPRTLFRAILTFVDMTPWSPLAMPAPELRALVDRGHEIIEVRGYPLWRRQ
jgi:hypothetical protein